MIGRPPVGRFVALACLCGFACLPRLRAAADEWKVPESTIRYKLDLKGKPTHSSAGYFAHLPDGGILAGTTVTTVVTTVDGKVVPSYLLWQNPESGFSMVFADPGKGVEAVYVYALSGRVAQLWNPGSGITPSAILAAIPGHDSLASAVDLSKLGRVEPSVHSANNAGYKRAPFSIGGDVTGRPRPGSFYLLSYVEAAEDGSYWFAPQVIDGKCDVLVDGTKIKPQEHSKKWGGTGASVNLTKGLHRVEVFQTAGGTGPDSANQYGGLMFLTWRPPSEKLRETVEARIIRDGEIVRSGSCQLAAVESKNGGPVAAATANPGFCYWFGNEEPLVLYDLKAVAAGQPADATYTWAFPKEGVIEGADVQWICPAFRDYKVRLTVKSAKGTSTCVVPFYSFSTQKTDLDKPAQRAAFRKALAAMLDAYAPSPDPVGDWSPAWWNNLIRTVEGEEEEPILARLFSGHLDILRKKLAPDQMSALQDLLLDLTQRRDPAETLRWIQKFQSDASMASRRSELKLREGELQMYYLGDRKQPEKLFAEMSGFGESAERAKVRLGDLAFMAGDLNKATAYYADVQRRSRSRRNAAASLSGGLVSDQFVQGGSPKTEEPDRRGSPPPVQDSRKTTPGADLKHGALQEVSLSENVRTLTDDGYYLEARQALLAWELEFPLSKISGDYILRESALFMKLGDWKRARPMLEAYCRQIDASGFLPEAASLLVACIRGAHETPSPPVIEIIGKVKDRLKYHPVAADLESFLSSSRKPSS